MLDKVISDLQNIKKKHFDEKKSEEDELLKSKLLAVTSISHGGKSFFFDNMKNNGFTFGNEEDIWPLSKTGQSQGYTLDGRFTRIFLKEDNQYVNYLTQMFGSNRYNGKYADITHKYADIHTWPNFKMVNFIRDPRIVWILENHYGCMEDGPPIKQNEQELENFITNEVNKVFDHYLKFKDYSLTIKFEDYISNFEITHLNILSYIGLDPHIERSSEKLTEYFTTIELNNPCFYTKHKQEFIDEISYRCKHVIEEFGYEETLTMDKIFQK